MQAHAGKCRCITWVAPWHVQGPKQTWVTYHALATYFCIISGAGLPTS